MIHGSPAITSRPQQETEETMDNYGFKTVIENLIALEFRRWLDHRLSTAHAVVAEKIFAVWFPFSVVRVDPDLIFHRLFAFFSGLFCVTEIDHFYLPIPR